MLKGSFSSCCEELTIIEVAEANPSYLSDDGILFNTKGKYDCELSNAKGDLALPEGVPRIEDGVFQDVRIWLVSRFPRAWLALSIGQLTDAQAFEGCLRLANFTIGQSANSIEDSALSGCESLRSMGIPGSAISIGEYAFTDCKKLNSKNFSWRRF